MATHQLTPPPTEFVDPRRAVSNDPHVHIQSGASVFTANAGGSTTTIVGANAAPGSGTNVVRLGDKFKLKNSSGALKQETVFTVSSIAVAGSTTVTFTPAASASTASGDVMQLVGDQSYLDNDTMDRRLAAISGTTYTQSRLDTMTQNDKVYALRVQDDPTSF